MPRSAVPARCRRELLALKLLAISSSQDRISILDHVQAKAVNMLR